MLAWRLCRAPFTDLTGEGARRYGGRWNRPGRPMVYAASSAALAVLEIRVHLDLPPELLPDDYVLLTIDLGDLATEEVVGLPADPADFGDGWLRERRSAALRVPSLIVPESPNLLLNPTHPNAVRASIVAQRRFDHQRNPTHASTSLIRRSWNKAASA
jgi:RES domain-containing protein